MKTINKEPEPILDVGTLDVELLGKPIHIIREKLIGVISESCISLTHELQNWLKTSKVEAKLNIVDLHTFLPLEMEKCQTSTYQHQNGGRVFVHADNVVLIKLADRFYGANEERDSTKLTNSDLRIQERISKLIITKLAPDDMWAISDFAPTNGVGLHAELIIQFDGFAGRVHLKLDSNLIQTLVEQLELQPNTDLYQPFCHSLKSTRVRLNVELIKKIMPLSDIVSLKPGDIFSIELPSDIPISIGHQPLFSGRIAERDDQLVLILN
ncbi:FliM/FliN family flagellar motor switch protein [Vibrio mimicus]|uniref:FliM/FliN family flagellar motor switch protein n=1 Tax=Vibrio mimicus TaxID=674 RepID=UPI002F9382A8